jgi:hypothetical protein
VRTANALKFRACTRDGRAIDFKAGATSGLR